MVVNWESLDCLMYTGLLCRARGRSTTLCRSTISALLVMIISMRSITMSRSEVTEVAGVTGDWLEVAKVMEVEEAEGDKHVSVLFSIIAHAKLQRADPGTKVTV